MDLGPALALLGFILPCALAASSGAFFPPDAWYRQLRRPSWNPPDWVFAPAWTLLFVAIAVSAWLVWRASGLAGAAGALAIWLISLGFNAAWSWLFFGRKQMGWAFAELVGLWLSILATIVAFAPHSTTAAWLLVPYLAWVTFAGALNFTLWRLNRSPIPG